MSLLGVSLRRLRVALAPVCVLASCLVMDSAAFALPNSEHPFEIIPGSFQFTPSSEQAGAHSDWVTTFDVAHSPSGSTYNDVRNVVVNLPVGFDASSTAVPTCTEAQLLGSTGQLNELPLCPIASQVGQISVDIKFGENGAGGRVTVPIYNMEVTSFGVAAELGFRVKLYTFRLVAGVRPGDNGLMSTTPNISKVAESRDVSAVLWGLPASHEHDAQRGETCGLNGQPPTCHNEFGGPQEAHIPVKPFLSNPTSCESYTTTIEAYSWEEPESVSRASSEGGPIGECSRVPFEPSIDVQPSTRSAESPTGLEVSLIVPQSWDNPFGISTANLKDARVTLPRGFTVNPSAGSGLGACTPAQYASETSSSLPGAGCPPESKIGSIEIETPILAEKIPGAVYVATPYDNPFSEPGHPHGSLLALYVVAKDPARGILVKVAGKLEADRETGQLSSTFLNNPQQPFSKFTLQFRPGATAPLVSPPACGSYSTHASLTPWSAPEEPRLIDSPAFEITQGVREGHCPSGGVPPLAPQVISGTQNNAAGSYSPFYLRIVREDGEQEITKFTTVLPPGLTGNLTGIPFCGDSAIEAARNATGRHELEAPSCPAASEIGHTVVGAGVGTVLAQTPGKVYLAGPYHGSALSIVSVTSAAVGPFDLGTVVIRFALRINPITAQAEVDSSGSDPIPHIIDGIVVHVRDIRVYMSRPSFVLNPTNCDPMSISATITGAGADFTNPADASPVTVSSRFQAADCTSLAFKPSFKVTTTGRTSRLKGAGLHVKLTYPRAPQGTQANIHSVKVDLPRQLPSRLTTLQKACPVATFNANPAACSTTSRVGIAKAITPILPVPLEGPAYFVSHGGAKFPELIMALQGYGITIDLHGETFISKAGITSSTFRSVPDNPIGSFELTLPQGPGSALAANGDLCKARLRMPTTFVGQNGAVIHQTTHIGVTNCPRHKKARRANRHPTPKRRAGSHH